MSVIVDHEDLAVDTMGLTTVGHVLHHLHRGNRLVVNLLIDGAEPDLAEMTRVRAAPLAGHTLFIETTEPAEMVQDVLGQVDEQLDQVDRLQADVVDALQRNNPAAAMEKLSGCFTIWNAARESLAKSAQLLRVDLDGVRVQDDVTLADALNRFAENLRQIKSALEARDYVLLADVLSYEMSETTELWRSAIGVVRRVVTHQ